MFSIGEYEIHKTLDEGGQAIVYAAYHTQWRKWVALKVLKPDKVANQMARESFQNEYVIGSKLAHPNILKFYESGYRDGCYFHSTKLLCGRTLADLMSERIVFDDRTAVRYALQIAGALEYLHASNIIHRDLKPRNLLLDKHDNLILGDFGISKAARFFYDSSMSLCGASLFMSPEQVLGNAMDRRTDIYSLGIILFRMLAGQAPFEELNNEEVRFRKVNHDPPSLRAYRPDIHKSLEGIVHRLIQRDPNQRYQSTAELIIDLKRFLRRRYGHPTRGRCIIRLPDSRRARLIGIALLGMIALIVGSIWLIFLKEGASEISVPGGAGESGRVAESETLGNPDEICRLNLDKISDAFHAYFHERRTQPRSLNELAPGYIYALPTCPCAHTATYDLRYNVAYDLSSNTITRNICIYCRGNNHENLPPNQPKIDLRF